MIKLVIITTVPITLTGILADQPKFLAEHFDVVIISSPEEELKQVSRNECLPIHSVPMQRGISPFKDLISLFKMIKALRKLKPDIVHSYTPKAGFITMLAGFLCRVPVRVHTFTGLIFPTTTGIKQKILIWMDRLICACATTIVPEGNGVKQDLINYGITKKELKVIGHGNIAGVNTDYFNRDVVINEGTDSALRTQLNLSKDAFLFCFVGRFTQDKGFFELLEAFNRLPENAHLLLVGAMDERLPLPKEITQSIKNHPRIHDIGWQDDVRPALAVSDVLVLPSYREGFPNTPLQAGAMALPCIVTDINGCNEIITPGINGWLVAAKNCDALFDAMLSSMKASNLTKLGENARLAIENKFEKTAHWQKMLDFYNEKFNSLNK
ncbi:glycosyltransferase family 4 protein [Shewanella sp. GutCb]|uniref:glycosyltransferase family 4 protein n=1 Tax=Shewanella sp. GutCb TaxID=2058315 RepID=UPI002155147E|nr:glycosyltransferase family 4 protein [Shewanella sp. GutCb]